MEIEEGPNRFQDLEIRESVEKKDKGGIGEVGERRGAKVEEKVTGAGCICGLRVTACQSIDTLTGGFNEASFLSCRFASSKMLPFPSSSMLCLCVRLFVSASFSQLNGNVSVDHPACHHIVSYKPHTLPHIYKHGRTLKCASE